MAALQYLGSKVTLLPWLREQFVERWGAEQLAQLTLVDAFAGTGAVTAGTLDLFRDAVANDLEHYAELVCKARFCQPARRPDWSDIPAVEVGEGEPQWRRRRLCRSCMPAGDTCTAIHSASQRGAFGTSQKQPPPPRRRPRWLCCARSALYARTLVKWRKEAFRATRTYAACPPRGAVATSSLERGSYLRGVI